jgi:hypothetical protein
MRDERTTRDARSTMRHECPLCCAKIMPQHFKRHLMAHDRRARGRADGLETKAKADAAWREFIVKQQASRRYPRHASKALIIDTSWSYCGACGKGAYPDQETHEDVADWTPVKGGGCGVRWEHVASSYCGPGIKKAATGMRPDLEWIDL